MNKIGSDSIGTVISIHRSIETAELASAKFQRAIRRSNGQSSYIPTKIVVLKSKHARGTHVHPSQCQPVAE